MAENTIDFPPTIKPVKIKIKQRTDSTNKSVCNESPLVVNSHDLTVTKKNVPSDHVVKAIQIVNNAGKNIAKNAESCTECQEVLGRFLFHHAPSHCPLRNSSYCSYCSRYGHFTKDCPTSPPPWATDIYYLEQLIPSADIARLGIISRTPISNDVKNNIDDIPEIGAPIPNSKGTIEIRESDKEIKAWLRAHGIPATENPKKNKILLTKYADARGLVIVWTL